MNKQALFDFSLAGPLCGMLASLAALAVGTQLTLTSDASLLPALPLEILRQSSLGGGVIDGILGNGALNVPEGAIGSQALAEMTINLHPIAVAGYLGLVVNALNVIPIGSKWLKSGDVPVCLRSLVFAGVIVSDKNSKTLS